MLNSATLLSQIQTELTKTVPRTWTTDTVNRRNEWLLKLQDRVEAVAAKEKTILANRALSDQGKAEQLTRLAEDSLPGFGWLGRVLADLDAAHDRFRAQLFTVSSLITDDLLRYLRAQEIRSILRDADPNQRDVAFLKPAEQNREEMLAAMLDAPMGPMVSDDIQHRALNERAKRTMPAEYGRYQQNELLRDYLGSLRDHVALWLRGLSVDPKAIHVVLGGGAWTVRIDNLMGGRDMTGHSCCDGVRCGAQLRRATRCSLCPVGQVA